MAIKKELNQTMNERMNTIIHDAMMPDDTKSQGAVQPEVDNESVIRSAKNGLVAGISSGMGGKLQADGGRRLPNLDGVKATIQRESEYEDEDCYPGAGTFSKY